MSRRIAIHWWEGIPFCPACQSPLGFEEASFECCDACDGTGSISEGDEDDDELYDPAWHDAEELPHAD